MAHEGCEEFRAAVSWSNSLTFSLQCWRQVRALILTTRLDTTRLDLDTLSIVPLYYHQILQERNFTSAAPGRPEANLHHGGFLYCRKT